MEEEWSPNHAKLLYLISKFAVCARTADDAESWIRNLPLIILLYEGIVAGCLDFDYAPASTLVSMVRGVRGAVSSLAGRQKRVSSFARGACRRGLCCCWS